jgi:hypothetical protein
MLQTRFILVSAIVLLNLLGCAAYSFRQVKLGDRPMAYNDALPRERTRHFPLGKIYLSETEDGKTTAICLVLGDNRRIVGKLMVSHTDRMQRWPGSLELSYEMVGEIDQPALGLDQAPPEDVARFLQSYFEQSHMDPLVRDGSELILIGIAAMIDPAAAQENYQRVEPPVIQPQPDPNNLDPNAVDPNTILIPAPTQTATESRFWRVPASSPNASAVVDGEGVLSIHVAWGS